MRSCGWTHGGDSQARRRPIAAAATAWGRGFTLIELAVALLVIAVSTALVAPSVGRGLDGLRTRAEIAGFVGFLRAAREQAVSRGLTQEVRLDPETLSLTITTEGSSAARASRSFSYLLSIAPDPPTATSVKFQPQGLSTGGAFRIVAPGQRRYLVTVDPLTGRVASRLADS